MYKELLNIEENTSKFQRETLTPYKVAVIMLIKQYCYKSVKVIIECRDFCIAALKLIQTPDMELITLLKMLRSPEYTLQRFAHLLESDMNTMNQKGVEGLLELFDSLSRLMKPSLDHSISPPVLYKNSVLGLYVRRIIIFFEQLPFSQVVSLFQAFSKEYNKIAHPDDSHGVSVSKIERSPVKK